MILGAGRGQVDLIRTAKEMGYFTVVASIAGNYPGFDVADDKCYVDISNPEAVSRAAAEYGVDGIATACLDTGISALGYTCDKNGFIGLSAASAEMSQNKLLMKRALTQHGVSTARFREITSREDLDQISHEFSFPMIVKAVDLQGSRGINIVYNREELFRGYEQTMGETSKDYCIVEEFIEGSDFSVQACIYNGEILFILPCGDITYRGSTNIPVGHYAPLEVDDCLTKAIEEQVIKAIHALGLNNCVVNIDLIQKGNQVYIIELTGRTGANCLPQITSLYYGMDIYKLIIAIAMGTDPREYFEKNKPGKASYAQMLISEQSGSLKRIVDKNEKSDDIYEITFFAEEGDMIRKFENSKDCVGQVVVTGTSLEECKARCERVITNIYFELEN